MGTSTNSQIQLKPYPITLSALHLSAPLSALHKQSGIELFLPKSTTNGPERFKAIIMESNTENLILKPFFTANIQDKIFDGIKYAKTPLGERWDFALRLHDHLRSHARAAGASRSNSTAIQC